MWWSLLLADLVVAPARLSATKSNRGARSGAAVHKGSDALMIAVAQDREAKASSIRLNDRNGDSCSRPIAAASVAAAIDVGIPDSPDTFLDVQYQAKAACSEIATTLSISRIISGVGVARAGDR